MNWIELIVMIIQALTIALFAPFVIGFIRKVEARMQHRVGSSMFQPYRDLWKLVHKESVISKSASSLFKVIPYICMAGTLMIVIMVPFVYTGVLSPYRDTIAMVYLFTMVRFALVLGGLEGGSTFGGMGSSRESMMSVLVEPALLLAIMTLGALNSMGPLELCPALLLAGASFVITTIAEGGRVPFDNPATHLELTMVHEGMVLEYSGRKLMLMEYSGMIRFVLLMTMLGTLFFPWGIATTLDPLALLIALITILIKILLFAFAIAVIESTVAKMRLFKLPNLLTASFTLSLLAMISLYVL